MFPENLALELTTDSTLFDKISMNLLIAAGCIGTNLIIIFVWDAIYKDYLKLVDELQQNNSNVQRKTTMVIRPELVLISVVNVLVCATLKVVERSKAESFLTVYFVALVTGAGIIIGHNYSKARVLKIASTETIVIQLETGEEVLPNATVYQIDYVLAWKDGSAVRHISLHGVQQVQVRKNENIVSTWKPEYRKNQFQWIQENV